jgi:hypothetical protein
MELFGGSITKHSLVDKVSNTKPSGRGTAFNHTIRQVYYTLRSIGISVSTIDFVIRPVLSMVDIICYNQLCLALFGNVNT